MDSYIKKLKFSKKKIRQNKNYLTHYAVKSAFIQVERKFQWERKQSKKRLMIRADFREQKAFVLGLGELV